MIISYGTYIYVRSRLPNCFVKAFRRHRRRATLPDVSLLRAYCDLTAGAYVRTYK